MPVARAAVFADSGSNDDRFSLAWEGAKRYLSDMDQLDSVLGQSTIDAILEWDPSLGHRFTTFLNRVVRNDVWDAIRKKRGRHKGKVRKPNVSLDGASRAGRAKVEELLHHRDRDPFRESRWPALVDWQYALEVVGSGLGEEFQRLMVDYSMGVTQREHAQHEGVTVRAIRKREGRLTRFLVENRIIGREARAFQEEVKRRAQNQG
jgi:DNA-directed RNA polymerase specialized sigma24 family protein